jgi:integrase/recombinase XerD
MSYQYRREPLTSAEADALLKACRTSEEKLVIWTLLDTGMRVSEAAALNRDSVDTQNHTLTLYGKGHKGRKKRRVIELSPNLRTILEPHLISYDVFGVTPRTMQRLLKRVASRAKIRRPVTPHVLRHTFAVKALRRGVTLADLKNWLGHSKLDTTAIYLNLAPEDTLREFRTKMW